MNAEKASFHRIRICHSPFLRTAALLLACILSAGSLSACSLAENREVVRLKEENGQDPADGPDTRPAGSGNIARQTAAPGELQLDFRDASGRLSVHVDAAVTVPDAEGFRLKKVSSRSFTQADSDAVNRVLLDGGVLLDDGVLRKRETMPRRAAYSVSLDNGLTPDRREISFLVMRKDTQIGFPLLTDAGTETLPDPQALTDQAVSSLVEMEIAGFQPVGAEYVSVSRQDFTGTVLEQHNGVRIPFERMVDGIPVTYTAEAGAGVEGENVSWPYEALSFCYDAQGLVSFQWTDPCIYTDISEEYVFLLPFEEICRIFRTVFPEKYAAYASDGREADFHITRIRLGYMRIMEPGNWMEGTLIPAWDFFGYWIYGDAAADESADSKILTELEVPEHYLSGGLSYSLLTVNACDGTVINRSLGY